MNDPLRMRRDQRICHLDGYLEQVLQIHCVPAPDPLLQALTFQLLHDNEGMTLVVVDVMNDANVGMVQLRGGARFAYKALQGFAIVEELLRNELQGNVTAKPHVLGFIDNPHAPAAEFSYDAIVGNSLADHRVSEFAANLRRTPPSGQLLNTSISQTRCVPLLDPRRDRRPRLSSGVQLRSSPPICSPAVCLSSTHVGQTPSCVQRSAAPLKSANLLTGCVPLLDPRRDRRPRLSSGVQLRFGRCIPH